MMNKGILLACLLLLTGCVTPKSEMTPHLSYSVQDKYLQSLRSIFEPLSKEESSTPWGQEYTLGLLFAKKLDLYRAITCFKRAEIIIDSHLANNSTDATSSSTEHQTKHHPSLFDRKTELEYQIVNAYYLGKRYSDAIDAFEESSLASTGRTFVAFRDLLVILFDAYLHEGETEKATWMIQALEKYFPLDAQKLHLTSAIHRADLTDIIERAQFGEQEVRLAELSTRAKTSSELQDTDDDFDIPHVIPTQDIYLQSDLTFEEQAELESLKTYTQCKSAAKELIDQFQAHKKNPVLAASLNAALPGLGYLYLGQTQTAFTAFWLNGLFIGTAAYFFHQGNIPAALITLGFESGWYFGGILGAKENAHFYNERIYEKQAHVRLRDHKLYPILMLSHGF